MGADSFRKVAGSFLERAAYAPPTLPGKALVQGHRHHKAIMTMGADARLFQRLGLDYELLDSGCCGMAGSFGFERDHYDVSVAVGKRSLLRHIRAADRDTLIVADGSSGRGPRLRDPASGVRGRAAG
jgi:hypothetical protein